MHPNYFSKRRGRGMERKMWRTKMMKMIRNRRTEDHVYRNC